MSTSAATKPSALAAFDAKKRHRLWIWFGSVAAIAIFSVLAAYGFDYYPLERAQRLLSTKHAALKPSGAIGHRIGILASVLFLLMYLYPLRKRWRWLGKFGKTKHWLDYHILMGLTAPVLITFHSAFYLHGIAGVAYWIMLSVVLSGIIGRYLFGLIPRRLDAAEMTMEEMQALNSELAEKLGSQKLLPPDRIAALFRLPRLEEVQQMGLFRALGAIVILDVKRWILLWKLRRQTGTLIGKSPEMKEALSTLRRQTALAKNILFLSKMHQVFHLWHVVHRPFSYSFAILVTLHIAVVLLLGYY